MMSDPRRHERLSISQAKRLGVAMGLKRTLPLGYQWKGFDGKRAQLRRLRQRFRIVEKLRDPASVRALARLHESLFEDPDPGFAIKHLAHAALLVAEADGTTWAHAVNGLLDGYERRAS